MGRTEKAQFRKDWASRAYKQHGESRSHVRSESHTDRSIGTYLNYDQVVAAEGGHQSPTAVMGARRYFMVCLK
eukprot:2307549-Lingulodinium_polyedra.AAC.1